MSVEGPDYMLQSAPRIFSVAGYRQRREDKWASEEPPKLYEASLDHEIRQESYPPKSAEPRHVALRPRLGAKSRKIGDTVFIDHSTVM
jgi:hypothetical protein